MLTCTWHELQHLREAVDSSVKPNLQSQHVEKVSKALITHLQLGRNSSQLQAGGYGPAVHSETKVLCTRGWAGGNFWPS